MDSETTEETPATAQFMAWVEAFNTGNRDTILAYDDRYFPIEVASRDVATIDREEMLSIGTGGFDIKKYQQSSSQTAITVIMKERHSRQFARATMEATRSRLTVLSVLRSIQSRLPLNSLNQMILYPLVLSKRPNGSGLSNEFHRRYNPSMSSQRSAKGWLRRFVNVW